MFRLPILPPPLPATWLVIVHFLRQMAPHPDAICCYHIFLLPFDNVIPKLNVELNTSCSRTGDLPQLLSELSRTASTSDHVKLVNFVQFGFKHLNRLVVGVCGCVCAMNSLRPRLGPDPVQSRAEELDGAGFVPSLVALCCPSVPSPCAIHYKFSLSGFFTFILSKLHTNRDCNSEASY